MKIYLFSGNGAGKTTNALGLALRSLGHGHNVLVIQFLKWYKETGEYKFMEKWRVIPSYPKRGKYIIKQYGRQGWIGLNNLTEEDKELCHKALDDTISIAGLLLPKLIILDEINLAIHCKLLTIDEIKLFLKKLPECNVVMTGRYASEELINLADFVNIITDTKFPEESVCEEGIQY